MSRQFAFKDKGGTMSFMTRLEQAVHALRELSDISLDDLSDDDLGSKLAQVR